MTKNEFLLRFNLLQLAESEHNYQHASPVKSAAVLIALVESENGEGLQVLLTKRASHLRHHPSQVSFPGGKVEKEDISLIDTALREAYEEIGLSREAITVLGQLPPYQTISGFHCTLHLLLPTSFFAFLSTTLLSSIYRGSFYLQRKIAIVSIHPSNHWLVP